MSESSSVSSFPPKIILSQFFDKMYGGQSGWVYVPSKITGVDDSWRKKFFEWPAQKDEMIQYICTETSGREIYYSPALWKNDCSSKERKITREDFKGTNFVWAEFDGRLPSAEEMEQIPPPTIKLRSSERNHEHWYWRLDFWENDPDSLENLTKRLAYALGADLSGWDFTQVLRPPATIHHESKKLTQILEENSNRVSIARFADLPDIPSHVWDVEIDGTELPASIDVLLKYPIPEKELSLIKKTEIPVGKRSSALTRLAHVCAEVGMSNVEILSVLINKDNHWGKFKYRGEEGQRKQLIGIIRYVRKQHPVALEGIDDDIPWVSSRELLSMDIKVEWIVPGLIQRRGVFFLVGPSAVGKTHMTFQIATHMALGKSYLDFEFTKPTRLCVIEMEIPPEEAKEEYEKVLSQFNDEEREIVLDNLMWVPTGFAINLKLPRIRDYLLKRVEEHKPEGIFWDSFQVAMGGDVSKPETLNEAFDFIKRKLCLDNDMFNWFIHHNRKAQVGNRKPKEMDDIFGGQAISAVATTVIGMWPEADNIEWYDIKTRYAKKGNLKKKIRRKDIGFEIINSGISFDSAADFKVTNGDFGDIEL